MNITPIRNIGPVVVIDSSILGTLTRMLHTKQAVINVIHETAKVHLPNATVEITDLRKSYDEV